MEDPDLNTIAAVRMARGSMPAHAVLYKPMPGEPPDYLICYQCGFILRMDAVMYCVNALDKFESMSPGEVQRVAAELAMLGSKGLDPNDATPRRCQLRSLPGQFSGLQRVSYLYVALKKVAPDQDIGFDLSAEYEAAQALYAGPSAPDVAN